MDISLIYTILFILGLLGFSVSYFIYIRKRKNKKMVCYVGKNCDLVVQSEYSKFLGFPLELLGMFYYILIIVFYLSMMIFSDLFSYNAVFWVLFFTSIGLLFSAYLTFIQGFVIKDWCEWCLTSAFICLLIFIFAFNSLPEGFIKFLTNIETSLSVIYSLSLAIALGSALISWVLFFKFLSDFKISKEETGILRSISQVIWVCIILITISFSGLYLGGSENFIGIDNLFSVILILSVIALGEIILNLFVLPKLIHISFGVKHKYLECDLKLARKSVFSLIFVLAISWLLLFILSFLSPLPFNFGEVGLFYVLLLMIFSIAGQFADKILVKFRY